MAIGVVIISIGCAKVNRVEKKDILPSAINVQGEWKVEDIVGADEKDVNLFFKHKNNELITFEFNKYNLAAISDFDSSLQGVNTYHLHGNQLDLELDGKTTTYSVRELSSSKVIIGQEDFEIVLVRVQESRV